MSNPTASGAGPEGMQPASQATEKFDRLKAILREMFQLDRGDLDFCLLYTSPSPRDGLLSRMPSSA